MTNPLPRSEVLSLEEIDPAVVTIMDRLNGKPTERAFIPIDGTTEERFHLTALMLRHVYSYAELMGWTVQADVVEERRGTPDVRPRGVSMMIGDPYVTESCKASYHEKVVTTIHGEDVTIGCTTEYCCCLCHSKEANRVV